MPQWRVKTGGAMLERLLGTAVVDGVEYHSIRVETYSEGQIVEGDLSPQFVERWENGEEHARSLVDRIGENPFLQAVDEIEEETPSEPEPEPEPVVPATVVEEPVVEVTPESTPAAVEVENPSQTTGDGS